MTRVIADFGSMRVVADGLQFVVEEVRTSKGKLGEYARPVSYHASLDSVIRWLALRELAATELSEALTRIEAAAAELKDAYARSRHEV